jgi:hypothetical protein
MEARAAASGSIERFISPDAGSFCLVSVELLQPTTETTIRKRVQHRNINPTAMKPVQ